jgi:hypothetical protein
VSVIEPGSCNTHIFKNAAEDEVMLACGPVRIRVTRRDVRAWEKNAIESV